MTDIRKIMKLNSLIMQRKRLMQAIMPIDKSAKKDHEDFMERLSWRFENV